MTPQADRRDREVQQEKSQLKNRAMALKMIAPSSSRWRSRSSETPATRPESRSGEKGPVGEDPT